MNKNKTRAVAFSGIIAALSVLILFIASLTTTAYLALAALAGALLCPLLQKHGKLYGLCAYAATSVLCLLLIPDKVIVLLYIGFFGLYSVIKVILESKCRRFSLLLSGKLVVFNFLFTLNLWIYSTLFEANAFQHYPLILVYLGANILFVIYDTALSRMLNWLLFRYGKYL